MIFLYGFANFFYELLHFFFIMKPCNKGRTNAIIRKERNKYKRLYFAYIEKNIKMNKYDFSKLTQQDYEYILSMAKKEIEESKQSNK